MTLTKRLAFPAMLALLLVSVFGCAETIQFQDPCPPYRLLRGKVVESGKVGPANLPFTRVSVNGLQYSITQYSGESRVSPFGWFCPAPDLSYEKNLEVMKQAVTDSIKRGLIKPAKPFKDIFDRIVFTDSVLKARLAKSKS